MKSPLTEGLRAIVDNFPGAAWVKDAESKYVYANTTYARLWGVDVDNVAGKTDYDIFPQDLAAQFQKNDSTVITEKRTIEIMEFAPDDKGNVHRWLVRKIYLEVDGVGYTPGFALDIDALGG